MTSWNQVSPDVKKNLAVSTIVVALSLFLYRVTLSFPRRAAQMPRILLVTMILLALGLALQTVFLNRLRKKVVESEPERISYRKVIVAAGGLVSYVVLLSRLGFFVSSFIFLPTTMWLMEIKRPKVLAGVTVVTMVFLYVVFRMFLRVPVPRGILF